MYSTSERRGMNLFSSQKRSRCFKASISIWTCSIKKCRDQNYFLTYQESLEMGCSACLFELLLNTKSACVMSRLDLYLDYLDSIPLQSEWIHIRKSGQYCHKMSERNCSHEGVGCWLLQSHPGFLCSIIATRVKGPLRLTSMPFHVACWFEQWPVFHPYHQSDA